MLVPQNTEIIFVRYKNDINNLIKKFIDNNFTVKVYEKDPAMKEARFYIPKNKGNEASGYLKYILDHYDCLPEYVVFLHDHEVSWHHRGSIFDRVMENIEKNISYLSLNSEIWNNENVEWMEDVLKWYDEYLFEELGDMLQYGDFKTGYNACAQFIVHKNIILKRSFNFYKKIYDWLMNTELEDFYSSRYLEFTWHLMWDQVPKNRKIEYHNNYLYEQIKEYITKNKENKI